MKEQPTQPQVPQRAFQLAHGANSLVWIHARESDEPGLLATRLGHAVVGRLEMVARRFEGADNRLFDAGGVESRQ